VPEFLHVLFNLVVKHSPVFFLAVLRFVSEKQLLCKNGKERDL